MSSAAEAIMNASAPPPRPAVGKAAAPDASGPSFDEHLATEEAPEAYAAGGAQQDDDAPVIESKDSEKSAAETQTAAPTPPLAPQQQAQAIVLQLIAQASGDAQPTEAPTNETPPVEAAPAPSAPTKATPNNASAEASNEAQAAHGFAKALEKSTAPEAMREAQPQTNPAQTTQPAAAPNNAAPAAPIQPANANAKSAPTKVTAESNADAAEASAMATAETPPVSPRPPEPRVTKATELGKKNDNGSVQEKLAAAIDSATPQVQAKARTDRAAPAPGADTHLAATSSAPDTSPQQLNALSSINAASATQAGATDPLAARATPAAAQVAREIVRRFDGESTKFEMRLDPPELGRVEVRLEVTRDHKVTAVLSADSPQALTELARHARELEQSLQSAGLELSDAGLSFDLSQSHEDSDDASDQNSSRGAGRGDDELEQAPLARPIGLERWRGVRVDVMV